MTQTSMEKRVRIEELIGEPLVATRSIAEGQLGRVLHAQAASGRELVAKFDDHAGSSLLVEARMLGDLAALKDIPCPEVIACAQDCLIMEHIPMLAQRESPEAERDAARLIARLHDHTAPSYGYDYDTSVGGVPQPNAWRDNWIAFFAEHRLLPLTRHCVDQKRLTSQVASQMERLIAKLPELLGQARHPGLVHGDLWGGNILWGQDRVAALIDPGLYYADPEVEIAFTTMFQTFSKTFYETYHVLRPLSENFWDERLPIYNLYPLLVHVRIYGGGYIRSVEETLDAFT